MLSWTTIAYGAVLSAAGAVVLGLGPLAAGPGRRLALVAALSGLAAFLVDVYLY